MYALFLLTLSDKQTRLKIKTVGKSLMIRRYREMTNRLIITNCSKRLHPLNHRRMFDTFVGKL